MAMAHLGVGDGAVGTVGVVGMAGAPITTTGTLGAVGTTPGGAVHGAGITRISTAGILNRIPEDSTVATLPVTTTAAAFRATLAQYVPTMALSAIHQEILVEQTPATTAYHVQRSKTAHGLLGNSAIRRLLPVSPIRTRLIAACNGAPLHEPSVNPHSLLPRVPSELPHVAEDSAEAETWAEAAVASAAVAEADVASAGDAKVTQ